MQQRRESLRVQAKRCGINPATVQEWRRHSTAADAAMGPEEPRSTAADAALGPKDARSTAADAAMGLKEPRSTAADAAMGRTRLARPPRMPRWCRRSSVRLRPMPRWVEGGSLDRPDRRGHSTLRSVGGGADLDGRGQPEREPARLPGRLGLRVDEGAGGGRRWPAGRTGWKADRRLGAWSGFRPASAFAMARRAGFAVAPGGRCMLATFRLPAAGGFGGLAGRGTVEPAAVSSMAGKPVGTLRARPWSPTGCS